MNDKNIEDAEYAGAALEALGEKEVPTSGELETLATNMLEKAKEARAWERSELQRIAASNGGGVPHFDKTLEEEIADFPDIVGRWEYFYERWPTYPAVMITHLQDAKGKIQSTNLAQIKTVGGVVEEWRGEARNDFQENFLDPFIHPVIHNQQTMFDELSVAMAGYQGMLEAARRDAKDLGDNFIKVMDSIMNGDKSVEDTQVALSVIGVVVTVVGAATAFATGGTGLALGLGLLGAGVTATKTGIDASQNISSDTVISALSELDSAMTNIKTQMDAEEQSIADKLSGDTSGKLAEAIAAPATSDIAILSAEPNDDETPNLGDGEVPGHDDFHPPR